MKGCPLPPLEAMASGVAVVCTNCGGINQYAKHEQNALIASSNTIEELTEHLKRVLTDSTLRARLVENGLKTAGANESSQRGVFARRHFTQYDSSV